MQSCIKQHYKNGDSLRKNGDSLRFSGALPVSFRRYTRKMLEELGKVGRIVCELPGYCSYRIVCFGEQFLSYPDQPLFVQIAGAFAGRFLYGIAKVNRMYKEYSSKVSYL